MFLDITKDLCPITFVKTKLALEKLNVGQSLIVKLVGDEARENVPKSLVEHGYKIKEIEKKEDGVYYITIKI